MLMTFNKGNRGQNSRTITARLGQGTESPDPFRTTTECCQSEQMKNLARHSVDVAHGTTLCLNYRQKAMLVDTI